MTDHSSKENRKNNLKPLFLVGPLRSGTTVLRLMINHHPKIAFPNEFEIVTPVISDNGHFPSKEKYHEWLLQQRTFRNSYLKFDKNLEFTDQCNNFLQQIKKHEKKDIVGSTVHNHFDRLRFLWPDAKYIHILRDGRDVARSFIPMGWAGNVYTGSDHWLKSEKLWDKLRSYLDEDQWHQVRYEDLIENTEKELIRICDFIGVEYDKSMLSYPNTTTYSAPSTEFSNQWKRNQTPEELGLIESRIGEMLINRGYELSGYPVISPTKYKKIELEIQSKIYTIIFRIKRYGFWLVAQEIISRKIGLRSWNRIAKHEIDKQVVRYLK
jgi:hypothetical protein